MAVAYRIAGWNDHFENNRTRELKKLDWVPMPNKQDGDGYTELLDHPDGAAHFGAWVAIVQVASKCDPRGTLLRDGAGGVRLAHTPATIARITRLSPTVIEQAICRLLDIGWVETIHLQTHGLAAIPQDGAALGPQDDAASRAREKGREGKGIEGKGTEEGSCTEPSSAPAKADIVLFEFPVVGPGSENPWPLRESKIAEWQEAYPDINIGAELRKARQWVLDRPSRRKTARGMLTFLGSWLQRAQNDGSYASRKDSPSARDARRGAATPEAMAALKRVGKVVRTEDGA